MASLARPRRQPRVMKGFYHLSEKQEQKAIVDYLRMLGADVYVLGTTRRKGDFQGTMQTPGIPDLWAFLPPAKVLCSEERGYLWIEVKARGGQRSCAQSLFSGQCLASRVNYVCGQVEHVKLWLMDRGWIRDERPQQVKHE